MVVDNPGEDNLRRKPPSPRPQEYYKENVNITYSDGPLLLPPLPKGHTFVVTISLTQMLTARCLFSVHSFEDPHDHISKVRSVCKSCVGRLGLNMDVIRLRVFPLSLMGKASIWFTELSYNSIYT